MRKRFTEREDAYLVRFYASLGVRACAEKLGRSSESVTHRVKLLRAAGAFIDKPRKRIPKVIFWNDIDDEIALKLSNDGKTSTEIAEALGRSPGSVRMRLSKMRRSGNASA